MYGDEAAVATYRAYFQGEEFKQHLADLLVQYAGAMAFSRDEETWKRSGVLKTDANEEWLRIDLTDERWMLDPDHTDGTIYFDQIVGLEEVVANLLAGAEVAPLPGTAPFSFWEDRVTPAFGRTVELEDVKIVQAALTESGDTTLDLINDADTVIQQEAFSLAVGNDGDNSTRSGYGDNILIGAKGDDTFFVETTPDTPTPPPPPQNGEPPQPPQRPTVMILGGEGHDIVDHSGQEERLTLSLDSVEEGSVKLVVATDAGKQIGEALDLVEELWLTNFGDTVTGSLTTAGKDALAAQPLPGCPGARRRQYGSEVHVACTNSQCAI